RPATGLSNSASRDLNASGEGVLLPAPRTEATAQGEVVEDMPGSKSVASVEGNARNEGGPTSSCRTNYEGQAGRNMQRQGATSGPSGVGLIHSIQQQDRGLEAGEGVNRTTQSAQATSPVRVTEQNWQTFLRAIAEKAHQDRQHRFGDLYRWLNRDVLRLCFYQ